MNNKSIKLLAVDDDPVTCRIVVDSFSGTDFHVLTAKDGSEALELINASRGAIDVLLVDVVMPILNGAELARIVLSAYPEIKIIFLSGQPDDVLDRYGIPQSRMRHIKKPFMPEMLVDAVCEELFG